MLQVNTSPTSLVPSQGIKHKHFVITEPLAMSNPLVTHQPFRLHKQQVQRCLPSLAQSPAVSGVLCHTLQEHPGLFAPCCTLLPAVSFPLQNPVPTVHGRLGRGAVTGEMHARWAGAKTLSSHSCRPVSAQDALAAPLLMGFWLEMQFHLLPHVEVPRLCKKWPVGRIPKALQCGVEEGRRPFPSS